MKKHGAHEEELGGIRESLWRPVVCGFQFGCFFGCLGSSLGHTGLVAPWHVGSQFPDQGSNPCPLHWKADSFQDRITREVLYYSFILRLDIWDNKSSTFSSRASCRTICLHKIPGHTRCRCQHPLRLLFLTQVGWNHSLDSTELCCWASSFLLGMCLLFPSPSSLYSAFLYEKSALSLRVINE